MRVASAATTAPGWPWRAQRLASSPAAITSLPSESAVFGFARLFLEAETNTQADAALKREIKQIVGSIRFHD